MSVAVPVEAVAKVEPIKAVYAHLDALMTGIEAMKKAGLTVTTPDAKTIELWQKTAEGAYPLVRGGVVPEDAFDLALKYRDEYRKQRAAPPAAPKK